MKDGVESLNAWHRRPRVFGHLDGGSEIRFDFHWSPRHIVLPHDTFGMVRLRHIVNGLLLEIWVHFAAVDLGQIYQLVDDTVYHILNADFVQQSTVLCCFEKDTCGVESNRTANRISMAPTGSYSGRPHPIVRSNCSCLMFVDILQLTWPVVSVIANA